MALQLRDYQVESINKLRQGIAEGHARQVLCASTGAGKCFGRDTEILMYDGTVKNVQDVVAGDVVMSPAGEPRNVLATHSGIDQMFKVNPVKGDPYTVNSRHVLSLRTTISSGNITIAGKSIKCDGRIVNVSLADYIASNSTAKHCLKGWRSAGVEFGRDKPELSIPPYILGAWLGDGTAKHPAITKPASKMMDEWIEYVRSTGTGVRIDEKKGCFTAWATNGDAGTKSNRNAVYVALENLSQIGNKHIPEPYKFASFENRLELIAGLLDSDGSMSHSGYDWISKCEKMADDFVFMCRSVGLAAYKKECQKSIKSLGFTGTYYRVSISGDTDKIPCRDKVASPRLQKKRHLVHGIKVEQIGLGEYFGFEVDGDHLFLLADFTVTHNSVIMLSMIDGIMRKGKRAWFFCERRVLVEQFSRHLDTHNIDHGVLMAGHWRFRPDRNIQVVSIQTLEKYDHIDPPDLLFIDECHVAIRLSVAKLLEKYPTMKVIGATATPFSKKLPKYFSNVVSVITMRELIEQGNLVPFRVFAATEINTDGLKINSMGEFEEKAAEERATHIIGDVVADYWRIAMMIYGEPRKAIVFTSGIAHGTVLTEKFNQSGVMAMQITANNTEEEKKAMLDEFAKPDSAIKILLCSEMLERGFDVTDIDFVILAKAIKKSFSRFVQMIGRGARPHEGKKFAVIQDHGSNWLRFSEQWQDLYHNGVDSLDSDAEEVKKREPTKKEKEESRCPKCGMIWQSGDTCLACGHQRSRRNQVVTIAGEAQEIDSGTGKPVKKKEATKEDKQAFYSQALAFAHTRGYSEGWAAHKYKTKFGVFPRSLDKVPSVAIGDEFLAFVQHQNIKYAKAKK